MQCQKNFIQNIQGRSSSLIPQQIIGIIGKIEKSALKFKVLLSFYSRKLKLCSRGNNATIAYCNPLPIATINCVHKYNHLSSKQSEFQESVHEQKFIGFFTSKM